MFFDEKIINGKFRKCNTRIEKRRFSLKRVFGIYVQGRGRICKTRSYPRIFI